MTAAGARPAGSHAEAEAAAAVREMFDSIAPDYDRLNHVLSAGVDRLWWWRCARHFRAILARPDAAVLDVCCGTGHLTGALLRRRAAGSRPILAADFARAMLARGAGQFGSAGSGAVGPYAIPIEADALHLPLKPASHDLIVSAFGFRNLVNYEAGLREFLRVLKPGGQLGILEFSEPGGLVGAGYRVYFRRVLPAVARIIGGKESAYRYLPESVGSFPPPEKMLAMMRACGYVDCRWQPYTFGIAGLYTGARAEAGAR